MKKKQQTKYTKRQSILEIITWLYLNDGKFPNKIAWRENFVKKLSEVIN